MYPPPAGPSSPMMSPHYREPPPPPPPPNVSAGSALGFAWSQLKAQSGTWATAALFGFIPIIGPIALQGWHAEIMQRLVRRDATPVPKLSFDDLMKLLSRGLPAFLVQLVMGGVIGVLVSVVFGCVGGVMGGVVSAMAQQGGDRDSMGLAMVALFALSMLVFFALMLPLGMMISGATLRAELTEDFSLALKLGEVWDFVKRTWKTQLVAGVVFAMLAWLIAFGGILLCFVGIYAMVPLLQLGALHLRYQMYQLHLSRGGAAIPVKAPEAAMPPPGYAPTY